MHSEASEISGGLITELGVASLGVKMRALGAKIRLSMIFESSSRFELVGVLKGSLSGRSLIVRSSKQGELVNKESIMA